MSKARESYSQPDGPVKDDMLDADRVWKIVDFG